MFRKIANQRVMQPLLSGCDLEPSACMIGQTVERWAASSQDRTAPPPERYWRALLWAERTAHTESGAEQLPPLQARARGSRSRRQERDRAVTATRCRTALRRSGQILRTAAEGGGMRLNGPDSPKAHRASSLQGRFSPARAPKFHVTGFSGNARRWRSRASVVTRAGQGGGERLVDGLQPDELQRRPRLLGNVVPSCGCGRSITSDARQHRGQHLFLDAADRQDRPRRLISPVMERSLRTARR